MLDHLFGFGPQRRLQFNHARQVPIDSHQHKRYASLLHLFDEGSQGGRNGNTFHVDKARAADVQVVVIQLGLQPVAHVKLKRLHVGRCQLPRLAGVANGIGNGMGLSRFNRRCIH